MTIPIRNIQLRRPKDLYLYVQVRIAGRVQPMIVPQMLQELPVGDKTFLFRKYERAFSGTDAVRFLITKRFARTEHEALAIGNALLRAGVFRHVRNEHLFRNGLYFYRFAMHEDYAVDDHDVRLRSSRMMTVACNSFMRVPGIRRVDTGPVMRGSNYSDEAFFASLDSFLSEDRPEFDEADVVVETGIRIGMRSYPDLVSNFIHTKDLVGTHAVRGKILSKSFTGTAAAKWFIRHNYANTVQEAVKIGNALMSSGVFYPLEEHEEGVGFECKTTFYRMVADTDISKELKRGARKDALLRLLGVDRRRAGEARLTQSPWFEEQMSFSFTSGTSGTTFGTRSSLSR